MDIEKNNTVERWGILEITLSGTKEGNPFTEVEFGAEFSTGHRSVSARGFYDGGGTYRVRFMPDSRGEWRYTTRSNLAELDGKSGTFTCTEAGPDNHGPVRVRDDMGFAYEDGTRYLPVGTTCYVWNHQSADRQSQTLKSLRSSPFNKIRMCIFPKHYDYNHSEPDSFVFPGSLRDGFDLSRFNPQFFQALERRIGELRDLGIEADIILFHPYDRWGFSRMAAVTDEYYLRYVVSRLSAFRNVWWSMANEYDLMQSKTMLDWDRFFQIVQTEDPSRHLRSIHNCFRFYDHSKPWVTHCSVQTSEVARTATWCRDYRKPVVIDECGYEGAIEHRWGNLTAQELVSRFWEGFTRGGSVGHGETYNNDGVLWWSHGGQLHGESPKRIDFLREILSHVPEPGLRPIEWPHFHFATGAVGESYYLVYFGNAQPALRPFALPDGKKYRASVIDTWNMIVTPLEGTFSGKCVVPLPGKPYMALQLEQV